ncbi:hypothetical protein EAH79_07360 [Sphingomonas koreensis]|nr:hypothetical protein EAH79_07360 [Sphingomonas koreensis]
MAKMLKFIALCITSAAVAAIVTIVLHVAHVSFTEDITYTDFISITLTALGLMITVLGLFVAAAGVIGWTTLESKLRSHSVEYFGKQLEKGGPLREELEEFFADIAYSGIEGLKAPDKEEGPYTD